MMSKKRKRYFYAAGVIERENGEVLIATPKDHTGPSRLWQFPRCLVGADESPEAAMCRFAEDELGVSVEVLVGQPPLVFEVDGNEAELRYFFCGAVSEGQCGDGTSEVRWVPRAHLLEYDFEPASRSVCEWILANRETGD